MACSLPIKKDMDHPICQHCYELIVGNAYRITSKEKGITMLDIVVCFRCFNGGKKASAPYRGNQSSRQASFSSKPSESSSATPQLIQRGFYTRLPTSGSILVNILPAENLFRR